MLEAGFTLNQFTTIAGVLYYTDAWVMEDDGETLTHIGLEE